MQLGRGSTRKEIENAKKAGILETESRLADLLDRRDLSEGFRWLAGGIVFCAVTPLLFSHIHLWTVLLRSTGDDQGVSWVMRLAMVIVVGKAIEALAKFKFGVYLRSKLFLRSISTGVSGAMRRKAGIGWSAIFFAKGLRANNVCTSNCHGVEVSSSSHRGIGRAQG